MDLIRSLLGQIRRRVRPTKDEAWLSLLERSTKERVALNGRDLPGFPPDELQRATIGSAGVPAVREAFRFYVFVRDACARHGRRLGPESRVLDFGMAWGRTVRCFLNDVSPGNLYGVDVSQDFMDAAKACGVPGSFALIEPRGELPHPSGCFDVVYAYSVFTHLPEDVQTHWLAEISRVLKPGGVFVATVEPRRFLQHCLSADPLVDGSPRNRRVQAALRERPKALEEFDHEGFVYLATSGERVPFGNAAMSPGYVRRHWGQWFTIVEYLDDAKRFSQAVVTALNG